MSSKMIQSVLDQTFSDKPISIFHFLLTYVCVTLKYLTSFGVTFTPYSV